MKQIQVTGQDAGQRLDKFLKRCFPEMGTSFLYKMLRKKNITLNGKKATGSEQIQTGDEVQCFFSEETFLKFSGLAVPDDKTGLTTVRTDNVSHNIEFLSGKTEADEYKRAFETLKEIRIIYEDEHLLLLDKPAGILSQKAGKEDVSLNEWMLGYLLENGSVTESSLRHFKPSVCNRLDRNTGGLVICGKSLAGSREMSRLLKERSLQKYYRTYVHGKMEGEATLTAYHKKDKKNNQAQILFSVPDAKKKEYDTIVTAYRTIAVSKDYSYLEIELITGKTHQIRAHLAALGHPIAGDTKYGSAPGEDKITAKTRKITDKSRQHILKNYPGHQLLHAYRIVFPQMDGELAYLSQKEFICPQPDTFLKFEKEYFD